MQEGAEMGISLTKLSLFSVLCGLCLRYDGVSGWNGGHLETPNIDMEKTRDYRTFILYMCDNFICRQGLHFTLLKFFCPSVSC